MSAKILSLLWHFRCWFQNHKYKKRTKTSVNSLIDNNENEITDSHKIGNALNAHFSDIGSKLASKIEKIPMSNNFSCTSLISSKTTSFYLKPITITEVLRHIKQLNPEQNILFCCLENK